MLPASTMLALFVAPLVVMLASAVTVDLSAMQFVGIGYNLLKANPEGEDTVPRGGIDPGLLLTRNILKLTGKDPPEAQFVQGRNVCASEEHIYYGQKSYQSMLSRRVDTSFGGAIGKFLAGFSFSMSASSQHATAETNLQKNVFYQRQSVCNMGQVRYLDELAPTHNFSVTENFAAAVCALPNTYNAAVYMKFLDTWGTHVITKADVGYRTITRYKSTLSNFVQHVMKQSASSITFGGHYNQYSASIGVDFDKFSLSGKSSTQFGSLQYTFKIGTSASPEPLWFEVRPMDFALTADYWKVYSSCHGNAQFSLTKKKTALLTALNAYPSLKKQQIGKDIDLRIPLIWPLGTYGLMQPKTGCPTGGASWAEGWNYEDLENTLTLNHASSGIHLRGSFPDKGNFKYYFCMKGKPKVSDWDMDWPSGDYCILKYGNCPSGFKDGYIQLDDNDVPNINKHGGTLPDGSFGKNTRIDFCCRDDALPTNPMYLPTEKPFFLFLYNRECQKVQGMTLTQEYLIYDTEDTSTRDHYGGAHPGIFHTGRKPGVHFCYYSPPHYSGPIIG
ncbi:uncharacterized protein [Haliotis cracherodii]|uniref:uncharacterized protein isoform X1 n=2 Tax=Haliotis cracherodii TaxID=6455 RepID=UPI0039E82985